MGGKKGRKAAKQRQKRVAMGKARRRTNAYLKARVKQLMGHGKKISVDSGKKSTDVSLNTSLSFAHCNGVGNCCKNRTIVAEPADVWRILHNERARRKFGLEITSDLVSVHCTDSEVTPLFYWVDRASGWPNCAIRRVAIPGSEEQVCPFWEMNGDTPECILGDDRLTYCKADPIGRDERLNSKRRLSGWTYALNDTPCMTCGQASAEEERNMQVVEWLEQCGMDDRFRLTDAFFSLVEWLHLNVKSEDNKLIAAALMFDWHRFIMESGKVDRKDVVEMGPKSAEEVLTSTRQILEGIGMMEQKKGIGNENGSGDAPAEK